MPGLSKPPALTVECDDVVHVVEFVPHEWASNIVAIGTQTRITVGSITHDQTEASEEKNICFETLRVFHHGSRVTALGWSPETTLTTVPKVLKFCSAGADYKLRLYSSDMREDTQAQILDGHSNYINSVSFDADKGECIASASDDQTCRIWQQEENGVSQVACLKLSSPGMTVCWHPEEPMKILVAQKDGIIKFYNLISQLPIMSLDCGASPLLSADWCLNNSLQVAAVAAGDWYIFDTARSSRPLENKQAHCEGCQSVRWSRSHSHVLSTVGRPGAQVKVYNLNTSEVSLTCPLMIGTGMSWHLRHPLLAVGGDKRIQFWHVDTM